MSKSELSGRTHWHEVQHAVNGRTDQIGNESTTQMRLAQATGAALLFGQTRLCAWQPAPGPQLTRFP